MKLLHQRCRALLATAVAATCLQPFAGPFASLVNAQQRQQQTQQLAGSRGLQSGERLPTSKKITPTAPRGVRFLTLNPDLPNRPDFTAGQAVTTATSPDGNTMLVLTSGYNRNNNATGQRVADESNEYVFVYDISRNQAEKRQVLQIPNTYNGVAWNPNGQEFYVSGGSNDNVRVFAKQGDTWAEASAPISLGHTAGVSPNGGTAVAGLAVNSSGNRLLVANFLNDSISVIDTETRAEIAEIDLRPGKVDPSQAGVAGGEYPFWIAIKGDSKAYVSSQRDREIVVLDISSATPSVINRIAVTGQPNKMTMNKAQDRLYVALDNSDSVAVIDTNVDQKIEEIATTAPRSVYGSNRKRLVGSNPNSLALSPDEGTLFVTNGGTNSVAVIRLAGRNEVVGLIPTGWYPNSVSISKDGSHLFVVNGKSSAGPNPQGCRNTTSIAPGATSGCASANQYVWQLLKAGLSVIPVPTSAELASLTRQVAYNNDFPGFTTNRRNEAVMAAVRRQIKHVIYIVKENKTFDQVLGDLEKGNGDPTLAVLPEPLSPNHHQLARQFVTLDNFYDSAQVSGDGFNWSTAATSTDYVEKTVPVQYAGRGLPSDWTGANRGVNVALPTVEERQQENPSVPNDPDLLPGTADVAAPDSSDGEAGTGYLWDGALRANLTVRNYGFFVNLSPTAQRERNAFEQGVPQSFARKAALRNITDPFFRGYDMNYPDFWRIKEWSREFDGFVENGNLPNLSFVRIGADHFGNFATAIDGVNTVETQMADNDYALGQLVEKVANSPYKNNTLIFVIEDDAQGGPDHIDAQRSIAYVIGPYVKQGPVVSKHYTTVSMIRTMEDVLGIEPLNINDALAEPMADVFDLRQRRWTYNAIVPEALRTTQLPLPERTATNSLPLTKKVLAYAKPRHSAAYWTAKMQGQNFDVEDKLDEKRFNQALWAGLKGEDVPFPTTRHKRDLTRNRQRLLAEWEQTKRFAKK